MDSDENKTVERENPRARAGLLSALTFAWTFDIFKRGFKKELETSDLCQPLPEHTAQLLGNTFEELWNNEFQLYKGNPKRRPSLLRVIFKVFGGKVIIYILAAGFCECVFKLGQPLMLSKMLQYFDPDGEVTFDEAKLYAAGVVICLLAHLLTTNPLILFGSHLGMKVRVATSSLIFRKTLRLNKGATSGTSAGHLVNLLSNDASRFDNAVLFLPQVFLGPIVTAIVAYLIWMEAGLFPLVGVVILIMILPLQAALGKRNATLRHRIALKTDCRVRLMNEIIAGIEVIKMYAWENSFAKLVALSRKNEVDVIRKKAYTVGFLYSASTYSTKVALFASMLAYASYGRDIRANVVYAMVLSYSIVENSLMRFFPLAVSFAAEAYVSTRRIESFLLSDEASDAREQTHDDTRGKLEINDVCAQWSPASAETTLDHLSVRVQPGSLVAIIGAVGSGKSSFLQLILREIPLISGSVFVGGTVSYASQEPWLFGGTVCQNILFGLPMDKEKYGTVVRVCALEADLKQLPHGDKTIIGDRGMCLSGGQRARINLARAVYRDADIYLLDDPLSAVDSNVSTLLFDECICGYLKGKTVVLATHHVKRLINVSHIIKLDNGKIVAEGSFQELYDIEMQSVEESSPSKTEETSILDVFSQDSPKNFEKSSIGKVGASVYITYFKAVKNTPLAVCVFVSFILLLLATSGSDYWLSFWVNNEESGFPEPHISIPLFGDLNRKVFIYVYSIFIGALIILCTLRVISYSIMSMRVSKNLHDTMFTSISKAPMTFFHNTPSGQILNRFSRDAGIIDETLPEALQDAVRVGLQVLGSLVIIFVINWYLMFPFIIVMVVFYVIRQYYVATSRSLKRIDSITRSPVYTHINETLQGLTTIRALGVQLRLQDEFDQKLDVNSSAWYFILGTNRAFAYYLDFTCFVYISLVTFSFLVWGSEFHGGDVGLAITQSMGLTYLFQWCVRQTAEVENHMTSVERVCEFTKVLPENTVSTAFPDKLQAWPNHGVIKFSDVSLFYETTAALKNLSFDIQGGEKIGVVGRTGAGKSSLVTAIFRLQKLDGLITIDGIETSSISLQDLRSRISIIPQDPVIFSGTMRFNLDPFEEYTDSYLWQVLEEVKLKPIVQDSSLGLDMSLSEGGSNLSVGQRQLVCLARAILRNSTVLILDEATANVDAETDDFIQAAIRKRFGHCTVITIAHRLNTIMDSDRILVMDNGKVAEFGPPQALLRDPKGHFTQLVGFAGPQVDRKIWTKETQTNPILAHRKTSPQ